MVRVVKMKVDRELSHRVAGVARDDPQSGWRTACLALVSDSQLEMGFYVEGWAVIPDNILVVEHAWIELGERIVDPTRWASGLAYFPALRFDKSQMLDAVVDCARLPLAWRSSLNLQDNPACYKASQAARALTQFQLACACGCENSLLQTARQMQEKDKIERMSINACRQERR
jgi:hypothetical protein